MEHLNREAKSQLSGLGSNITNAAVTRIGNALGEVVCILENFDNENGIKRPSARHSKRSSEKDMVILLKQLQETSKVFYTRSGRTHQMFPKFNQNLMNSLCLPVLMQWQLHKIKILQVSYSVYFYFQIVCSQYLHLFIIIKYNV